MRPEDLQAEGWEPHVDDTFVGRVGGVMQRRRDGMLNIGLMTDASHGNLSGILHGGVMMTLIDRAIGIACREAEPGTRIATASLTVNFLRQVQIGDFVQILCQVRKSGRKAIFADAEAMVNDRPVTIAQAIMMRIGT